ncbi:S26 family signal peptidase [Rhodanobacter sp. FW106-PBR-R2A-1-13]|uniref:S26 family signal peptidase n=1 Tax=Rhodanobacter sp. FW106-PBR-R2A-1-13 TaxID=3454845 RepID=UPI0034E4C9A8
MSVVMRLGERVHPRARRPQFIFAVLVGALAFSAATAYALRHYRIGYSAEAEQSVGSAWTLVRLQKAPVAVGEYGVFAVDGRVARFPAGTLFVKRIVGGPGDLIEVAADVTRVNGKVVAGPLDSVQALGKQVEAFERTFILAPGDYFAVGTRSHSYDSRYWGPVHSGQFVGQATLL